MKKKDFEKINSLKQQIEVVEEFLEGLNMTLSIGPIECIDLKITDQLGDVRDFSFIEQYLISDIYNVLVARKKEVEQELKELKKEYNKFFKE